MTWPEICDELVRRWPDDFEEREASALLYSLEYECELHAPSLDDIDLVCCIIGAVVWSVPHEALTEVTEWRGIRDVYGSPADEECVGTQCNYPTRAEAELAALGAWLEATR